MKRKKIILALMLAATASICYAQEKREIVPPGNRGDTTNAVPKLLENKDFTDNMKVILFGKGVYIPLNQRKDTVITRTFTASELYVNQAFIDSLDAILFDRGRSASGYKLERHFHLGFEQKDSLNYFIQVLLDDIPGKRAKGFFEQNGYFYWFGSPPPGIILGMGSEKQISYNRYVSEYYDPILWFLTYNRKTGEMKNSEWPF